MPETTDKSLIENMKRGGFLKATHLKKNKLMIGNQPMQIKVSEEEH